MAKKDYSYIDSFHAMAVRDNEAQANKALEALRKLMAEHGEALADAIEYEKRGADYKIKAVEDDCRAWLKSTHAPAYLHADNIERARQSLGAVALGYYAQLAKALQISFGRNNRLYLSKDVAVSADGSWRVSERFVNAHLEAGRVTLSNEMAADYEAFLALRRDYMAFANLGYNSLCSSLPYTTAEEAAQDYPLQYFAEAYDRRYDSRKMK